MAVIRVRLFIAPSSPRLWGATTLRSIGVEDGHHGHRVLLQRLPDGVVAVEVKADRPVAVVAEVRGDDERRLGAIARGDELAEPVL
jgi:hypothetical protein